MTTTDETKKFENKILAFSSHVPSATLGWENVTGGRQPVWPDWAFLKDLGDKDSIKSTQNYWWIFGPNVKNNTFHVTLMWLLFWPLSENLRLLFNSASSHSVGSHHVVVKWSWVRVPPDTGYRHGYFTK